MGLHMGAASQQPPHATHHPLHWCRPHLLVPQLSSRHLLLVLLSSALRSLSLGCARRGCLPDMLGSLRLVGRLPVCRLGLQLCLMQPPQVTLLCCVLLPQLPQGRGVLSLQRCQGCCVPLWQISRGLQLRSPDLMQGYAGKLAVVSAPSMLGTGQSSACAEVSVLLRKAAFKCSSMMQGCCEWLSLMLVLLNCCLLRHCCSTITLMHIYCGMQQATSRSQTSPLPADSAAVTLQQPSPAPARQPAP